MATVVPAPKQADFLNFALGVAGLRQKKELAEEEIKLEKKKVRQSAKRIELFERAQTLDEKKLTLEELKAPIVQDYMKAQTEQMIGSEKRAADMAELERQIAGLRARGMTTEVGLKESELSFLKSLTPEETKEYYSQSLIKAQLMNELRAQSNALQQNRLQFDILKETVNQQQFAQQQQVKSFNDRFASIINAWAGTPFGPAVAETSKQLFSIQNNKDATPEQKSQAFDRLTDVLTKAASAQIDMQLKTKQAETKITGEQAKEQKALGETVQNKEAFSNEEAWQRHLANPGEPLVYVESSPWYPYTMGMLGNKGGLMPKSMADELGLAGTKQKAPAAGKSQPADIDNKISNIIRNSAR